METSLRFSGHRIFSFNGFKLAFGDLPNRCFGDLAGVPCDDLATGENKDYDRHAPKPVPTWLPARLMSAAQGWCRSEPLLKEVAAVHGNGLHVPVQQLLSGQNRERCRTYALTDRALDLFNKGQLYDKETPNEDRPCHQLVLVVRPSVIGRLNGLPEDGSKLFREVVTIQGKSKWILPIRVSDLRIYHFATDRVICQLALEARLPDGTGMTSAALIEMVDMCGRFPQLAWLQTAPQYIQKNGGDEAPELIEMPGFTVGSLLARIVLGDKAKSSSPHRTFTHAFGSIAPDEKASTYAQLHAIASHLARQYTSDYSLRASVTETGTVADFDNVVHVISREGAASIIDPRTGGKEVNYLKNYLTDPLEASYLPILVLNLHQHLQAMELAAVSVLDMEGPDTIEEDVIADETSDRPRLAQAVEDWRRLQDKLALLHSRFRFRQISPVTMHNSFNKALRSCFGLDELEAQLKADLEEMSNRVQTAASIMDLSHRQAFRDRFRWVAAIVAGAVACVAVLDMATAYHQFQEGGVIGWEKAALGAAVAIAVIAMWLTYWKSRGEPD